MKPIQAITILCGLRNVLKLQRLGASHFTGHCLVTCCEAAGHNEFARSSEPTDVVESAAMQKDLNLCACSELGVLHVALSF